MNNAAFFSYLTELVIRVQHGDLQAFDDLFLHTWDNALRFVTRHFSGTLTPSDVEDVVQQTMISAHTHICSLHDPHAFWAWFLRILTRNAIAMCRLTLSTSISIGHESTSPNAPLPQELLDIIRQRSESRSIVSLMVNSELVDNATRRIQSVYSTLTKDQRSVFRACVLNLFSEGEASAYAGIPVGSVRSAHTTIRKRLRAAFARKRDDFKDVPSETLRFVFVHALDSFQRILSTGTESI